MLAVGYCCNCSYDPPMVMVGIVPSRYSYKMIKESGCFVVNLVGKEYKETYRYLGSHSKRDEDKLAIMNVNLGNGVKVDAPILVDCPVNIERKVVDSIVTTSMTFQDLVGNIVCDKVIRIFKLTKDGTTAELVKKKNLC